MSDRDGRKQWAGELPIETIEAMRDADKPMWEIVNEAVRLELGLGDETTVEALERQIREVKREEEEIEDDIARKQERLENLSRKRENLESRKEEILENRREYGAVLDEILETLAGDSERNVYSCMDELREAARIEYGRDTQANIEKVIEDVRARQSEKGSNIDGARFTKQGPAVADGDGGPTLKSLNGGEDDE